MGRKKNVSFGSTYQQRKEYIDIARRFLNKLVRINGQGSKAYKVDSVVMVYEPLSDSYAELIDGPRVRLNDLTIINQKNRVGHRSGNVTPEYINNVADKWKYKHVKLLDNNIKYIVENVTFQNGHFNATIFGPIGSRYPFTGQVLLSSLRPAPPFLQN